jgi:DNA-binding Lrp family transcriptional regulator
MSHTGVGKHISKLEDTNTPKIQGNISIKNLNYYAAFILMEMKNFEEVQEISEAYSECPRIFLLARVTGQNNLIFGIVEQDMDVLRRYINYCGPTNKKGVLHSAIIFASDLILSEFLPINFFSKESQESKCGNFYNNCGAYLDGKCGGSGNF